MSTSAHVFPGRIRSIHAQARSTGTPVHGNRGIKVIADTVIHRSAAELYEFCRRVENLPPVLGYPVTFTPVSERPDHWTVSVPFEGRQMQWSTAIINDEPGRLIAWQSLDGAPVPNAGTLRFEPIRGSVGTKVTAQVEFDPPGKLASIFSGMVRSKAKHHVADALQRLKQEMEMS
ncbi:MAG TPA: SRPBCC family protein [Lacunisphaera sp.]|nr:SRPBCC family protein [Lacunisphaera sp.]